MELFILYFHMYRVRVLNDIVAVLKTVTHHNWKKIKRIIMGISLNLNIRHINESIDFLDPSA